MPSLESSELTFDPPSFFGSKYDFSWMFLGRVFVMYRNVIGRQAYVQIPAAHLAGWRILVQSSSLGFLTCQLTLDNIYDIPF